MRSLVKNTRYFPQPAGLTAAIVALTLLSMAANAATSDLPLMEQGIQIGDLAPGRAIIWSRADRA